MTDPASTSYQSSLSRERLIKSGILCATEKCSRLIEEVYCHFFSHYLFVSTSSSQALRKDSSSQNKDLDHSLLIVPSFLLSYSTTSEQMLRSPSSSICALGSPNSLTSIGRAVSKTLAPSSLASLGLRNSYHAVKPVFRPSLRRNFSSSQSVLIEYFPPPKDAPNIKVTPPAWHHPVYTEKQMNDIIVAHRQAETWSDWVALGMVRLLRWGTDLATGYKHPKAGDKDMTAEKKGFVMNERKWMVRFIFLETVS